MTPRLDLKACPLTLAATWALAGCILADDADPCEGEPHIDGEITELGERSGADRVLIEEDPDVVEPTEPGGGKLWLSLTGDTAIFVERDSGARDKASEDDLLPGRPARGWIDGGILDSYPGQANAACIVVTDEP